MTASNSDEDLARAGQLLEACLPEMATLRIQIAEGIAIIMENQMEKQLENNMESRGFVGMYRDPNSPM